MSLRKYDKEWLEELCKDSYSLAEVLRKAGRKQAGGNQDILKKKIAEFGIDTSHFTGMLWNKGKTAETDERIARAAQNQEKYSLKEVFTKNSPITQHGLRGYVERYHLIEYKCDNCGCNGNWQDGIIKLELDHINGISNDNELENLHYLCPNCHALTETFRGRNKTIGKQKEDIISEADFVKALQEKPNIRQALLSLGLAAKGANYTRANNLIQKYNIQK